MPAHLICQIYSDYTLLSKYPQDIFKHQKIYFSYSFYVWNKFKDTYWEDKMEGFRSSKALRSLPHNRKETHTQTECHLPEPDPWMDAVAPRPSVARASRSQNLQIFQKPSLMTLSLQSLYERMCHEQHWDPGPPWCPPRAQEAASPQETSSSTSWSSTSRSSSSSCCHPWCSVWSFQHPLLMQLSRTVHDCCSSPH